MLWKIIKFFVFIIPLSALLVWIELAGPTHLKPSTNRLLTYPSNPIPSIRSTQPIIRVTFSRPSLPQLYSPVLKLITPLLPKTPQIARIMTYKEAREWKQERDRKDQENAASRQAQYGGYAGGYVQDNGQNIAYNTAAQNAVNEGTATQAQQQAVASLNASTTVIQTPTNSSSSTGGSGCAAGQSAAYCAQYGNEIGRYGYVYPDGSVAGTYKAEDGSPRTLGIGATQEAAARNAQVVANQLGNLTEKDLLAATGAKDVSSALATYLSNNAVIDTSSRQSIADNYFAQQKAQDFLSLSDDQLKAKYGDITRASLISSLSTAEQQKLKDQLYSNLQTQDKVQDYINLTDAQIKAKYGTDNRYDLIASFSSEQKQIIQTERNQAVQFADKAALYLDSSKSNLELAKSTCGGNFGCLDRFKREDVLSGIDPNSAYYQNILAEGKKIAQISAYLNKTTAQIIAESCGGASPDRCREIADGGYLRGIGLTDAEITIIVNQKTASNLINDYITGKVVTSIPSNLNDTTRPLPAPVQQARIENYVEQKTESTLQTTCLALGGTNCATHDAALSTLASLTNNSNISALSIDASRTNYLNETIAYNQVTTTLTNLGRYDEFAGAVARGETTWTQVANALDNQDGITKATLSWNNFTSGRFYRGNTDLLAAMNPNNNITFTRSGLTLNLDILPDLVSAASAISPIRVSPDFVRAVTGIERPLDSPALYSAGLIQGGDAAMVVDAVVAIPLAGATGVGASGLLTTGLGVSTTAQMSGAAADACTHGTREQCNTAVTMAVINGASTGLGVVGQSVQYVQKGAQVSSLTRSLGTAAAGSKLVAGANLGVEALSAGVFTKMAVDAYQDENTSTLDKVSSTLMAASAFTKLGSTLAATKLGNSTLQALKLIPSDSTAATLNKTLSAIHVASADTFTLSACSKMFTDGFTSDTSSMCGMGLSGSILAHNIPLPGTQGNPTVKIAAQEPNKSLPGQERMINPQELARLEQLENRARANEVMKNVTAYSNREELFGNNQAQDSLINYQKKYAPELSEVEIAHSLLQEWGGDSLTNPTQKAKALSYALEIKRLQANPLPAGENLAPSISKLYSQDQAEVPLHDVGGKTRINEVALNNPEAKTVANKINQQIEALEYAENLARTNRGEPPNFVVSREQVQDIVANKAIIQLKATDGTSLKGKTAVIERILSTISPRSFIFTENVTSAEGFINTAVLSESGRKFYGESRTKVIFINVKEGGFSLVDLQASSFKAGEGKSLTASEVRSLLEGTKNGTEQVVFVTDYANGSWTRLQGNSVQQTSTLWEKLTGTNQVCACNLPTTAEGTLMRDIAQGKEGQFLIMGDEISANIYGQFASSEQGIRLSDVKDKSLLNGAKNGNEAISNHHQAIEVNADLAMRRLTELENGQFQSREFIQVDRNAVPADGNVHARAVAGIIDQALRETRTQNTSSGRQFRELAERLRDPTRAGGGEAALADFEALRIHNNSTKLGNSLDAKLADVQADWNQLARIPGTEFAQEGSELVLRQNNFTSGERLSTTPELIAFHERGSAMLEAAKKTSAGDSLYFDQNSFPKVEEISISPRGGSLVLHNFVSEMIAGGNTFRGLDSTPHEAIHALNLPDAPIETLIKPKELATAQTSDAGLLYFAEQRARQYQDKTAILAIDRNVPQVDLVLDQAVALAHQAGAGFDTLILAQNKKSRTGLVSEEFVQYNVKDGKIDYNHPNVITGGAEAWNQRIISLTQAHPEKLLLAINVERGLDPTTAIKSLSHWTEYYDATGKAKPTSVNQEQLWRRDRTFEQDHDMIVITDRTNLTRDNVSEFFSDNLNQKLAASRFQDALDALSHAPERALDSFDRYVADHASELSWFDKWRLTNLRDQLSQDATSHANSINTSLSRTPLQGEALRAELYVRGEKTNSRLLEMAERLSKATGLSLTDVQRQLGATPKEQFISLNEFQTLINNETTSLTPPRSSAPHDILTAYAQNNSTNPSANPRFRAVEAQYLVSSLPTAAVASRLNPTQVEVPVTAPTLPLTAGLSRAAQALLPPALLNIFRPTQPPANPATPTLNSQPLLTVLRDNNIFNLTFFVNNQPITVTHTDNLYTYQPSITDPDQTITFDSDHLGELLALIPSPTITDRVIINDEPQADNAYQLTTLDNQASSPETEVVDLTNAGLRPNQTNGVVNLTSLPRPIVGYPQSASNNLTITVSDTARAQIQNLSARLPAPPRVFNFRPKQARTLPTTPTQPDPATNLGTKLAETIKPLLPTLPLLPAPTNTNPPTLLTDAEVTRSQDLIAQSPLAPVPTLNSQTVEEILGTENLTLTFTTSETEKGYERTFITQKGKLYYTGGKEDYQVVDMRQALSLLPDPADVISIALNKQTVPVDTYSLGEKASPHSTSLSHDLSVAVSNLVSQSNIIPLYEPTQEPSWTNDTLSGTRLLRISTHNVKESNPNSLSLDHYGTENAPLELVIPSTIPPQSFIYINNVKQPLNTKRININYGDTITYGNMTVRIIGKDENFDITTTNIQYAFTPEPNDLQAQFENLEKIRVWATSTTSKNAPNRFIREKIRYPIYQQDVASFEKTVQQRYQDLSIIRDTIFGYLKQNPDDREGTLNLALVELQKLSFTSAEINKLLSAINNFILQHERVEQLKKQYQNKTPEQMWTDAFGFPPAGKVQIYYSYNTINLVPSNLIDFGRSYHISDTTTKNEPSNNDILYVINNTIGFHKNISTQIENTANIFNVSRDDHNLTDTIIHEDQHGLFSNLQEALSPNIKTVQLAARQKSRLNEIAVLFQTLKPKITTLDVSELNTLNLSPMEQEQFDLAKREQRPTYIIRDNEVIYYNVKEANSPITLYRGNNIRQFAHLVSQYSFDARVDAEINVANEILAQITGRVAVGIPLDQIVSETNTDLNSSDYTFFQKAIVNFKSNPNLDINTAILAHAPAKIEGYFNQSPLHDSPFAEHFLTDLYSTKTQEAVVSAATLAYKTLILKGYSHASASFLLQSARLSDWPSVARRATSRNITNSTPNDIDFSKSITFYTNSDLSKKTTVTAKNPAALRSAINVSFTQALTTTITRRDGSAAEFKNDPQSLTIQYYDIYGRLRFASYTSSPTLLANIIPKATTRSSPLVSFGFNQHYISDEDLEKIDAEGKYTYRSYKSNRHFNTTRPIVFTYALNGKRYSKSMLFKPSQSAYIQAQISYLSTLTGIDLESITATYTNPLGLKEVIYPFGRKNPLPPQQPAVNNPTQANSNSSQSMREPNLNLSSPSEPNNALLSPTQPISRTSNTHSFRAVNQTTRVDHGNYVQDTVITSPQGLSLGVGDGASTNSQGRSLGQHSTLVSTLFTSELTSTLTQLVDKTPRDYSTIYQGLLSKYQEIQQLVHSHPEIYGQGAATFVISYMHPATGQLYTFRLGDAEQRLIRNGAIYHTDNLLFISDSQSMFNGQFLPPAMYSEGNPKQAISSTLPVNTNSSTNDGFSPYFAVHQLVAGDIILNSSDGYSKKNQKELRVISEADILNIVQQNQTKPDQIGEALIQAVTASWNNEDGQPIPDDLGVGTLVYNIYPLTIKGVNTFLDLSLPIKFNHFPVDTQNVRTPQDLARAILAALGAADKTIHQSSYPLEFYNPATNSSQTIDLSIRELATLLTQSTPATPPQISNNALIPLFAPIGTATNLGLNFGQSLVSSISQFLADNILIPLVAHPETRNSLQVFFANSEFFSMQFQTWLSRFIPGTALIFNLLTNLPHLPPFPTAIIPPTQKQQQTIFVSSDHNLSPTTTRALSAFLTDTQPENRVETEFETVERRHNLTNNLKQALATDPFLSSTVLEDEYLDPQSLVINGEAYRLRSLFSAESNPSLERLERLFGMVRGSYSGIIGVDPTTHLPVTRTSSLLTLHARLDTPTQFNQYGELDALLSKHPDLSQDQALLILRAATRLSLAYQNTGLFVDPATNTRFNHPTYDDQIAARSAVVLHRARAQNSDQLRSLALSDLPATFALRNLPDELWNIVYELADVDLRQTSYNDFHSTLSPPVSSVNRALNRTVIATYPSNTPTADPHHNPALLYLFEQFWSWHYTHPNSNLNPSFVINRLQNDFQNFTNWHDNPDSTPFLSLLGSPENIGNTASQYQILADLFSQALPYAEGIDNAYDFEVALSSLPSSYPFNSPRNSTSYLAAREFIQALRAKTNLPPSLYNLLSQLVMDSSHAKRLLFSPLWRQFLSLNTPPTDGSDALIGGYESPLVNLDSTQLAELETIGATNSNPQAVLSGFALPIAVRLLNHQVVFRLDVSALSEANSVPILQLTSGDTILRIIVNGISQELDLKQLCNTCYFARGANMGDEYVVLNRDSEHPVDAQAIINRLFSPLPNSTDPSSSRYYQNSQIPWVYLNNKSGQLEARPSQAKLVPTGQFAAETIYGPDHAFPSVSNSDWQAFLAKNYPGVTEIYQELNSNSSSSNTPIYDEQLTRQLLIMTYTDYLIDHNLSLSNQTLSSTRDPATFQSLVNNLQPGQVAVFRAGLELYFAFPGENGSINSLFIDVPGIFKNINDATSYAEGDLFAAHILSLVQQSLSTLEPGIIPLEKLRTLSTNIHQNIDGTIYTQASTGTRYELHAATNVMRSASREHWFDNNRVNIQSQATNDFLTQLQSHLNNPTQSLSLDSYLRFYYADPKRGYNRLTQLFDGTTATNVYLGFSINPESALDRVKQALATYEPGLQSATLLSQLHAQSQKSSKHQNGVIYAQIQGFLPNTSETRSFFYGFPTVDIDYDLDNQATILNALNPGARVHFRFGLTDTSSDVEYEKLANGTWREVVKRNWEVRFPTLIELATNVLVFAPDSGSGWDFYNKLSTEEKIFVGLPAVARVRNNTLNRLAHLGLGQAYRLLQDILFELRQIDPSLTINDLACRATVACNTISLLHQDASRSIGLDPSITLFNLTIPNILNYRATHPDITLLALSTDAFMKEIHAQHPELDTFLSYFPAEVRDKVRSLVQEIIWRQKAIDNVNIPGEILAYRRADNTLNPEYIPNIASPYVLHTKVRDLVDLLNAANATSLAETNRSLQIVTACTELPEAFASTAEYDPVVAAYYHNQVYSPVDPASLVNQTLFQSEAQAHLKAEALFRRLGVFQQFSPSIPNYAGTAPLIDRIHSALEFMRLPSPPPPSSIPNPALSIPTPSYQDPEFVTQLGSLFRDVSHPPINPNDVSKKSAYPIPLTSAELLQKALLDLQLPDLESVLLESDFSHVSDSDYAISAKRLHDRYYNNGRRNYPELLSDLSVTEAWAKQHSGNQLYWNFGDIDFGHTNQTIPGYRKRFSLPNGQLVQIGVSSTIGPNPYNNRVNIALIDPETLNPTLTYSYTTENFDANDSHLLAIRQLLYPNLFPAPSPANTLYVDSPLSPGKPLPLTNQGDIYQINADNIMYLADLNNKKVMIVLAKDNPTALAATLAENTYLEELSTILRTNKLMALTPRSYGTITNSAGKIVGYAMQYIPLSNTQPSRLTSTERQTLLHAGALFELHHIPPTYEPRLTLFDQQPVLTFDFATKAHPSSPQSFTEGVELAIYEYDRR